MRRLFMFVRWREMTSVGWAGFVLQVIEGATSVADIVRGSYNSITADKFTQDAGMDIATDLESVTILAISLSAPTLGSGCDVSIAETCWFIAFLTLNIFTGLEYLNGWGPPDEGKGFDSGRSKLGNTHEYLEKAVPDYSKWSGEAADKYAKLNRQLCGLVDDIADADQAIMAILQHQGYRVQQVREALAAAVMTLAGLLLFVSSATGLYCRYSESVVATATGDPERVRLLRGAETGVSDASMAAAEAETGFGFNAVDIGPIGISTPFLDSWLPWIVLAVCAGVFAAAAGFIGDLMKDGNANAADIRDQRDAYETARSDAAGIVQNRSAAAVWMQTAPRFTASTFSAIAIMPEADEASRIAKSQVVGAAGGSGDKRVPVSALAGDGTGFGNRALAAAVPEPQPPPFTPPAPAGLGQPADGATKLSGEVFAQLHLGDRAAGQVSPLASMGWRRAAPAAKSGAKDTAFVASVPAQAEEQNIAVDKAEIGVPATPRYALGVPVELRPEPARELTWAEHNLSASSSDPATSIS